MRPRLFERFASQRSADSGRRHYGLGLALVKRLVEAQGGQVSVESRVGEGSTFAAPIYQEVGSRLNGQGITVNYQSIGSGGGIRQLTNRTVFFGATDGPMTADQLLAAAGKVLHLPTVLGAVVPVYNIAGVDAELKFTGPLLADIFLGKVTKWNDPAIAKLNPGVKLPGTEITIVHRSDGSGTTYIFADYLGKVSPEWKKTVGIATSLNWPGGVGAKGNEGVAGLVTQTPGSIGYVELAYATTNKLAVAENLRKAPMFSLDERQAMIRASVGDDPRAEVDSFTGLLVDYHLDRGNGVAAIREIRRRFGENLPAVLITADRSPHVRAAAREDGRRQGPSRVGVGQPPGP